MSFLINDKLKSRNSSLDVIRIVALFCVISVHFFLNTGFYNQIIIGKSFYIMCIVRTAFMVCVPLFILLTGYLMNKKELNRNYYKGIVKTLGIYILSSIVCLMFKSFYLKENITIKSGIFKILDFNACEYSWYIEMYIGLFLLIPFLNLIYNNLKNKKQKMYLIAIMIFLTAIPTITNIYNFNNEKEVINNELSLNYNKILPFWWEKLYPLTYYFIGAYINEYRPKLKVTVTILLLLFGIIVFGTLNYFRSYGKIFNYKIITSWGSAQNTILSVLLFILLLNLKLDKVPLLVKRILKYVSDLVLGGYLLSEIADKLVYKKINSSIILVQDKFKYFIIVVITVFIISLSMSAIVNLINDIFIKLSHLIKIERCKK